MALSINASSYALSNYTSSTSSSKSTASVNASTNALSNYTSMASSSSSSSSSSKSTSASLNASSNALSNYTSSTSSSSSAVNKTISAEAWNASATPSSPTPNASTYALSNYTSTTASPAPAASSSASSSATPNASSYALSNYTKAAATAQASSTPNASTNALSSYLWLTSKGQESTAAKVANFAVPAAIAGTSGAAAEASGIDLLAAFSRSMGGGFAALGALAAGFVLLSTSPAGAGEDELVHQLGLGNISPATKKGEKGEQPETAPTDAAAKVVPNPYGKKGGPAHQAGVSSAVDELRKKYEAESEVKVTTEVRVVTPGGQKNSRYLDAAAVDGDGAVVEGLQVGRTNKTTDEPVSRERKAMQDVQDAIQDALIGFRKIRGK